MAPQWPTAGQAAITVSGSGDFSSPGQTPTPTASTAKLMTAYVFLLRYPLWPGKTGPSFTVSAAEASRYSGRLARSESVVPLRAGQRITERHALQALLGTSANNVADELARWYGSTPGGFVAEMNRTAHQLGMYQTTYTSPSGLDATSVSTASDQVRLLRTDLRLPDFAALASSSYTDVLGHRHANTNPLLGRDGVFAGKTGRTTPAGHNLVFAAYRDIAGRNRLVIGAVMAQPSASALTAAATKLLAATDGALVRAPVVRAGETLAWARDGWGNSIALRAREDLSVTGPPGATATLDVEPGVSLPVGTPVNTTAAHVVLTGLRPAGAPVTDSRIEGYAESGGTRSGVSVALRTEATLPGAPPLFVLPFHPLSWLAQAVTA
ncbi:D-alanyl-D-alanine carboxypeptidase family protein [Streptomyces vinaceus]|uniref:D-alanyl-D-alanine carboxypeptidase family protein n=1 Tax=Streptomyces vinaceus TaxID=1960 RepID=UPI00381EBBBE